MLYPQKVNITINGKTVSVFQGVNSFQDLAAAAVQKAQIAQPVKFTVTTSAASQNTVIGGNQSYVISGGEVLTAAFS